MRRPSFSLLSHALLLAAAGASGLGAQQLPSRDSTYVRRPFVISRDSVTLRSSQANEAELMRVINELRGREARLLRRLMVTPEEAQADRLRLIEELQLLAREAFTVMSVIESRCLDEREAMSNGYLGINITTEMKVVDQSAMVGRSVITSIEPGSPAERAGFATGDRVLVIGGRDARDSMPTLAGLIEPGRRIVVRVERDGAERDVSVVAGVRPAHYKVGSCPSFERALQPLRMGAVGRVWMIDTSDAQGNRLTLVTPTPPKPQRALLTPRAPTVGATPTTPATPIPPATANVEPVPTPPAAPSVAVWGVVTPTGSSISYFAGAQFRALDDDWRSVLGLREGTQGVLVNEVAPGSAAAQAGLRVGDVVTHANDTAATSPFVLSRLLGVSEGGRATLQVIRAREPRTITLRWNQR